MNEYEKILIPETETLLNVLQILHQQKSKIVVVCTNDKSLLGVIADGDIRRYLLNGGTLDDAVKNAMNSTPIVLHQKSNTADNLKLLEDNDIPCAPLVDENNTLVGVLSKKDLLTPPSHDNWVVLMAGGKGIRLRPLTEHTPKPLLRIGDKPVLETILNNFIKSGFSKFYISINYLGEQIQEYFGDGSKWGVQIRYLEEDKELGTAGCLKLIQDTPTEPLIVMNGDILTNLNFSSFMNYHLAHSAKASMVVREHVTEIPFGVVTVNNEEILKIEEKPVHRHFINAGIYIIDPDVIDLIPQDEADNMPSLFEKVIENKGKCYSYPLYDFWLDIGRHDDLTHAQQIFSSGELIE